MSEAAVLWIVGVLVTLVLGLGSMLLAHFKDCRDFRVKMSADIARLQGDVNRVIIDIGSHETGLRGSFHDLRDRMTPLAVWAEREMERREQK